ncbi:uncharacterized protein LOC106112592 [Falco peregrinus]|uniref:uncharacterized protein LOC106112592 n=1 Tax=Falco peregrinus TaxID=8954 RepID=UPI000FFCAAE2|nr:uncharacterized protein LOC106112592 [Falco peregrinus]
MLKGERWWGKSAVSHDKFGKSLRETFHPEIQKDLLALEEQEGPVNFKFGVLYAKDGQLTDDEMFGNGVQNSVQRVQNSAQTCGQKYGACSHNEKEHWNSNEFPVGGEGSQHKREAYAREKKEKPPSLPEELRSSSTYDPIPDDLLCPLCKDPMMDAAVILCYGASYCDECIRTALLELEEHTCPACHQAGVSPDALVANNFLRQAVNNFQNGTGYTKGLCKEIQQQQSPPPLVTVTLAALVTATKLSKSSCQSAVCWKRSSSSKTTGTTMSSGPPQEQSIPTTVQKVIQ